MKHLSLYLVVLFCLVVGFSSCSISSGDVTDSSTAESSSKVTADSGSAVITNQAQGENNIVIYDNYFDMDCLKQPTPEAVANVYEGMGITDIIERIGKPHNIGPFSGVPSLEWQVTDGSTCCIVFSIPQEAPKNISAIEQLMQYGIALRVIITES